MKKMLLSFAVLFFIAACNNKGSGWTAAQRAQFLSDCTNEAKGRLTESKAKSYCECMQPKLESKFPSFAEANTISSADIQTPEWAAEVQKCIQ